MRYQPAPASLFVENRRRLCSELPPGSLVIVHANDVMPSNADGTIGFVQNSDLFYLTGMDQEQTVVMLFPDAPDPRFREILFVRETSEHLAVWEGEKLTREQAEARSGISKVLWLAEFEALFRQQMCQAERVYLNTNEHPRAVIEVETRERRFIRRCQTEYPLHRYERLAPILYALRMVKSPAEVDVLKEAIRITHDGFRRVLKFVKPGVKEYEVEAELIHEYLRQGADGFAYSPIIASGKNACVLHYVSNHESCRDGDLLLLDVAASYGHYNADLTRTIPVSGRFTQRQRAVYEAVHRVYENCLSRLRPGVRLREYHEETGKVMEQELMGLGLLDPEDVAGQDAEKPLYKRYFMHGTSHHLGLDVHDVGSVWQPVQAGMVFTIEPGIYIREENLGVRLENNVYIGEHGNVDLMADIPIQVDEIEALMQA